MTIELRAGASRAMIDVAHGGRLASLVAGGRERLVTTPDDQDVTGTLWGCFPMAPWAGRVANGIVPFDGQVVRVRRNLGSHSIHGVVFDRPWEVTESSTSRASLQCTLEPELWPFGGEVGQVFELTVDALSMTLTVTAGAAAMPAACGWHPWFRREEERDARVTVAADKILVTRPDLIPTGELADVDGDTDLRAGPLLGERRLDTVYAQARSPAVLQWEDLRLIMDFAPPLETAVVYSPPGAVCVELQTAWPDAPGLDSHGIKGTGLARLEPRSSLVASARWSWQERGSA